MRRCVLIVLAALTAVAVAARDPNLNRWYALVAQHDTHDTLEAAPLSVVLIGDSLLEGAYGTSVVPMLRDLLQADLGTAGRGYVAYGDGRIALEGGLR